MMNNDKRIIELVAALEFIRENHINDLGMTLTRSLEKGIEALKEHIEKEGLEQEQKQEKEKPRSEIETFLDLAEQSSIRK